VRKIFDNYKHSKLELVCFATIRLIR